MENGMLHHKNSCNTVIANSTATFLKFISSFPQQVTQVIWAKTHTREVN